MLRRRGNALTVMLSQEEEGSTAPLGTSGADCCYALLQSLPAVVLPPSRCDCAASHVDLELHRPRPVTSPLLSSPADPLDFEQLRFECSAYAPLLGALLTWPLLLPTPRLLLLGPWLLLPLLTPWTMRG